MSAKTVFPAALALTLLSFCAAHAQYPTSPTPPPATDAALAVPPEGAVPAGPMPTGPASLSTWITGNRPGCCGPVGGDGPIGSEIYVRTGPSINLGHTGPLNDVIHTGWMVEGGFRSLFFTPDRMAAWTVDIGVSNIVNQGKFNPIGGIPLTILVPAGATATNATPPAQTIRFGKDVPGLTIRSLYRTAANLALGREWYLTEPAGAGSPTWRAGFDVGGRWGSENIRFHELRHRSKVFEGVSVALHTDVEVPMGCWTFLAGLRLEWDYTWSELLQTQTDLTGINLLVNLGVRY